MDRLSLVSPLHNSLTKTEFAKVPNFVKGNRGEASTPKDSKWNISPLQWHSLLEVEDSLHLKKKKTSLPNVVVFPQDLPTVVDVKNVEPFFGGLRIQLGAGLTGTNRVTFTCTNDFVERSNEKLPLYWKKIEDCSRSSNLVTFQETTCYKETGKFVSTKGIFYDTCFSLRPFLPPKLGKTCSHLCSYGG